MVRCGKLPGLSWFICIEGRMVSMAGLHDHSTWIVVRCLVPMSKAIFPCGPWVFAMVNPWQSISMSHQPVWWERVFTPTSTMIHYDHWTCRFILILQIRWQHCWWILFSRLSTHWQGSSWTEVIRVMNDNHFAPSFRIQLLLVTLRWSLNVDYPRFGFMWSATDPNKYCYTLKYLSVD